MNDGAESGTIQGVVNVDHEEGAMFCDDVNGNDGRMSEKVRVGLNVPRVTYFGDVNGYVWRLIVKRGEDAHPVPMGRSAEDILTRNDIYTDVSVPGFLKKDDVSGKRRGGGYI